MEVGTKPDARMTKKQVKIGAAQEPLDAGIYDHRTNGQLCLMHSRKVPERHKAHQTSPMACTEQMDNVRCGANGQKRLDLTHGHCETSDAKVISPMPSIGLSNDSQKKPAGSNG
jgi:hypothetical protein